MSAYNTTLLDEDDNEIYPKTLAENVYDGNTRMDQKVDGIRTDLGNPSSASAVTGADAFSKISKLNSDLASLRSNVNLLKVVWVDFTATTSANGNVSLTSIINTELNLPIAVSAHYKSNPSLMVACMLYQYTSSRPNFISGFRCFNENAQTEPILNTEIEGRVYALKIAPF